LREKRALNKAKVALTILLFFSLLNLRFYGLNFSPEAKVTASTPTSTHIKSFELKIFSTEELYPGGVRSNALIPYAFSGEKLSFTVSIFVENNSQTPISTSVVLSQDDSIDDSDVFVELDIVGSSSDDNSSFNFAKEWTVPPSEYGLKKIFIITKLEGNVEVLNNGAPVGEVFLNPEVLWEVTSNGSLVLSLNFEASPGSENVQAKENPITVTNLDPSGVGTKLKVFVTGTDLRNNDETAFIPISNMKVNEKNLSSTPQLIFVVDAGSSATLEFVLDYPTPLPDGVYGGTITIIFEVV